MREIEFRAWDKINKIILPSFLLYDYMSFNEQAQSKYTPISEANYLMQYTWLKDKNWKQIFEWDIILIKWEKAEVAFKQWAFGCFFENEDFYILSNISTYKLSNINLLEDIEIIWNIYEWIFDELPYIAI